LIYRILNKKLPGEVFNKNDGWMRHTQLGHILGSEQLLIDFLPAASKKDFSPDCWWIWLLWYSYMCCK